jgi:hypothetical protein
MEHYNYSVQYICVDKHAKIETECEQFALLLVENNNDRMSERNGDTDEQ